MDGTKITRQRDGRAESYMVDIKITRQRMENQMVGMEINLPKGWTTQT